MSGMYSKNLPLRHEERNGRRRTRHAKPMRGAKLFLVVLDLREELRVLREGIGRRAGVAS